MIKEIQPFNLKIFLWRTGPYIYFYKTQNDEINKSIVQCMNEITLKYKTLTVLQMNLENEHVKKCMTTPENINTVFLCFDKKIRRSEFEPNRNKIEEIFQDGLKYYRERLEISFKKQGTKIVYGKNEKLTDTAKVDPAKVARVQRNKLTYRKNLLMKEWMKMSTIDETKSVIETNPELSQTIQKLSQKSKKDNKRTKRKPQNNNFENLEKINIRKTKVDKINDISTNELIHYSKKIMKKNSQEWFSNIETLSKLPNEFLDELTIPQSPKTFVSNNGLIKINQKINNDISEQNHVENINVNYQKQDSLKKYKTPLLRKKLNKKDEGLSKSSNLDLNKSKTPISNDFGPLNPTQMVLKYADELINLCDQVVSIPMLTNSFKFPKIKPRKRRKYINFLR